MKRTLIAVTIFVAASFSTLSGHIIRGILYPTQATAFVSSPSAAEDVPIAIRWGADDTGLRIACFNVANTAPVLPNAPGYPRIAAVGFELPGAKAGFTLLGHEGEWQVVNNAPASLLGRGNVTLDFVLLARGAGLPPGQAATRPASTRFCVSGPFPEGLTIEQLINGVAVGFQAQANGPIVDVGLWDNPLRVVPLFP
jgi:hypothetical protein